MTQEPIISLIVASARNNVIGNANTLPWRMPSDLAHFKALTIGKAMIMGRKTWQSIGKPLPGRVSVVVSKNLKYQDSSVNTAILSPYELYSNIQVHYTSQVNLAINAAKEMYKYNPLVINDEIMIIGGAQIYTAALPLATRIYRTLIDADIEGDAFFPEFKNYFQIISQSVWQQGEMDQFPFRTEIWERS